MELVSYGPSYRAPSWRLVGRVPLKAPWRAGRSRARSGDGRAWTNCSACACTARAKDFVYSGLPLVHGERTKTAPKRAGGHSLWHELTYPRYLFSGSKYLGMNLSAVIPASYS